MEREWGALWRRTLLSTGLGLAGMAVSAAAQDASAPKVRIAQGDLAGTRLSDGGAMYAGIPYAAPPVGPLRWRAPMAPARWSGTRDASKPGPTCPQPAMGWNNRDVARANEDCLSVNVWVPAGVRRRLPVMVWYHGGAFIGGSGSAPIYNATALTRNGVIVVTVNYRLGVLGFLAHPDLSRETPQRVSGNYGVQDQIAALEWVHRNIARFGGDPSNVTIFGQSAGAMSASILATIPAARRYFRRAIFQSGTPFGIGDLPSLGEAERADAAFGRISDLRALPVEEVVRRWSSYASSSSDPRGAIPIVDGHLLAHQPAAAIRVGAIQSLPVMLGSVVREIPPASATALEGAVRRTMRIDPAATIATYEQRGADPAAGDAGTQLMTDMMFRCGTIATARSTSRAWLYHFLDNFPGLPVPGHSAEVFYLFDTPPAVRAGGPFDDAQRRLSELMARYWANFATRGDPNGGDLPAWPAYASKEGYMELSSRGVSSKARLRDLQCRPFVASWSGTKR